MGLVFAYLLRKVYRFGGFVVCRLEPYALHSTKLNICRPGPGSSEPRFPGSALLPFSIPRFGF